MHSCTARRVSSLWIVGLLLVPAALADPPVVNDQAFNVAEDAALTDSVGTIVASDADLDPITFAVTGGSGQAAFNVDANSGEITVAAALDHETDPQLTLDIEITAGGEMDTATITIDIDDVMEAPSVADQGFNVDENVANDTVVGTVVASDEDDLSSFTFAFNPVSAVFAIDANSGEITTAAALDHEGTDQYSLTVEVTDNDLLVSTATITIDVNDLMEAPDVSDQNFNVNENEAVDTVVGTIVASDQDDMATFTFAFNPASSEFAVDPDSGEITTAVELDHETTDSYMLTVEVTDNDMLVGTATITISVGDVMEAPSVADQAFSVDENQPAATVVGTVVADDVDDMASLTFAFNPASTEFAIDNNGEITTLVELDHETDAQYTLTVEVTDNDLLMDTAEITIDVNDLSEAPAVADQVFSVDENVAIGTVVGTVVANDVDDMASLSFAFNPASSDFAIDSDGEITTLVELDREVTAQYMVTVEVTDNDMLSDTATITIDVNNVNEPPTVNDQNFNVDENQAAATVVGSVAASDPDAMTVFSYAFDPASAEFAIDAMTGEITTLVALDHEGTDSYTLNVVVSDEGGLSDNAEITIAVNDIADAPDVADQGFDVDENLGAGASVGTVAASDQDGGDLTFAFNPASVEFAIDNNGDITTLMTLDHEATDQYVLSVEVTDNTLLTSTATITIDVNDLNEQPQIAAQPFSVDENVATDTSVGTVVASDVDDGDMLTFSITGGTGQGVFLIDANSGEITTDADLDHETTDSYTLDVEVVDTGMLASSATMTITINDINEAPVVDDQQFDIDENSPIGSSVGTVVSSDVDDMDTRTYQITGGTGQLVFAIGGISGEITTTAAIDHESVDQYTLTVQVEDAGGLIDTAEMTIDINDINEAPTAACVGPVLLDALLVCNNTLVPADLDAGSSDPDDGDAIQLSINPAGPFPVGLTLVTLTVTDNDGLSDSCLVSVTVLGNDCNGNTFPDSCDIENGVSEDCNLNAIPDECDINPVDPDGDGRVSRDVPADGVPDECQATELFVDVAAPGSRFGVDWDNAYTDLQDALRIARNPTNAVNEIRIADGTYQPTALVPVDDNDPARNITFDLASNVTLLGGFAGSGAVNPDARNPNVFITNLSGDLGFPGFIQDSRHVLTAEGVTGTTIDGVRLVGGWANEAALEEGGAQLLSRDSDLTINNVRFSGATTEFSGASILIDGGSLAITASGFTGGTATENGGAIYIREAAVTMQDTILTNGYAGGRGGAIGLESGSLLLIDCDVQANQANTVPIGAVGEAGAIVVLGGTLELLDCLVNGNTASGAGGAMRLLGGSVTLVNTRVEGNSSAVEGGAVAVGGPAQTARIDLINSVVRQNMAPLAGAILIDGDGRATISSTTITDNTPNAVVARAGLLVVQNSIVALNGGLAAGLQIEIQAAAASIVSSLVEGDPLFAPGTVLLTEASPAIDVGDNTLLPPDTLDLDGDMDTAEPLPQDILGALRRAQLSANLAGVGSAPFVDLGAIEFQADCDLNGIDDADEIAADPSLDCNLNGIKDVCEPDCNANGIPDDCDVDPTDPDGNGSSEPDCNGNGVPDSCDIASLLSEDCDLNGIPDECESDADGDGTIDACDGCPNDATKLAPGTCGCGVPETDGDGDGVPNCIDACQGADDTLDTDGDGTSDCLDLCPTDPTKIVPGDCGCGNPDTDTDGDGTSDCIDTCPDVPGPNDDADSDGLGDLCDNCPDTSNPDQTDSDADGLGDECDPTPFPPTPPAPEPIEPDDERMDVEEVVVVTVVPPPPAAGPGSSAGGGSPLGDAPDGPGDDNADQDPGQDDPRQGEQDVPVDMMPVGCGAGCGVGAMPVLPLLLLTMGGMRRARRRR